MDDHTPILVWGFTICMCMLMACITAYNIADVYFDHLEKASLGACKCQIEKK